MLIDVLQAEPPVDLRADVLVIGAGAVGLSMAVDLVRRGAEVTLLEAGPPDVEKASQEFFESARWYGYPLEGLHVGRRRALGGTTTAWPGQLVPFDPVVFEQRPWVEEVGWPIDRCTLDPFYARAFDLLGLEQRMSDDAVWGALKTRLPDLGNDLDVFLTRWTPEPNFAVLFKDEIARHPKLHVLVNATATGLLMAGDQKTVEGVTIRRADGTTHTLRARSVVLANGTVEIARLLSVPLSSGERAPWSANPWLGRGFTDHVDAYAGTVTPIDRARFHDIFDNIMLRGLKYTPKIKLSEEAQRRDELLGIAVQFLFNSQHKDHLDKLKVPVKALLHGHIDRRVLTIPGLMLPVARLALPMLARYLLHKRTYNLADQGIQLRLTSEQKPLRESCLMLRPERDALGMPLIDLSWQIDGTGQLETMARFCEMVRDYFDREKLARLDLNPLLLARDPAFLAEIDDGNHQMGMARMAATEEDGVVDANLRVYGSENLYVAGAATFPTTGFANPTMTGITLGLRLAEHLTGQLA
ncbi:MAG TPA: FAD-dependent oxidoreductase [Acidobacteriaceae bacterium]